MKARSYVLVFAAVALCSAATAMVASTFSNLRNCPGDGYTSDMYLAYCGSTSFGDYEHGAFYFGTEPAAIAAASSADVVFLGDSRVQLALSNRAVVEFFQSRGIRFYNLGFGYIASSENATGILRRWNLRPKLVVINADPFFSARVEAPLDEIRKNPVSAFIRTVSKALAERVQALTRRILSTPPYGAVYRSRHDGGWDVSRIIAPDAPKHAVDPTPTPAGDLRAIIRRAEAFAPLLPARKECVVLTFIPADHYTWEGAKLLAASMGASYVAPTVDGLSTMDRNHLNPNSAAKWSAAFLKELEPFLSRCLIDDRGATKKSEYRPQRTLPETVLLPLAGVATMGRARPTASGTEGHG
jgi:hypothetical protein